VAELVEVGDIVTEVLEGTVTELRGGTTGEVELDASLGKAGAFVVTADDVPGGFV
jgi:hypothetical protein